MDALKLTDDQEKELFRLKRLYRREANRCREAKAYLAGCVMAGSELETMLLLMVSIFPDDAAATGQLPLKNKVTKRLTDWNLAELLKVAKAAGWLPSGLEYGKDDWDRKKAKVGDWAEVARETRNLAHPARYLEDHYRQRITKRHLEAISDTIKAVADWLVHNIHKSILERLEAESDRSAMIEADGE